VKEDRREFDYQIMGFSDRREKDKRAVRFGGGAV
jgi:hypothetical protein